MEFKSRLWERINAHPDEKVQYLRLMPILERIVGRQDAKPVYIIALDGRAASGKTTMARQLAELLDAEIIHMDDFFLPMELRTEQRLATPGGNVHYERFREEVLPHLSKPEPFAYRKFECSIKDYNGVRQVGTEPFRIVEGSYSLHPELGDYADLTVFSDVEQEEQLRRIRERNGEGGAKMFRNRWIPLEEAYFSAYHIAERADTRV